VYFCGFGALREIFLNDKAEKERGSHGKPQSRQEEKTQTNHGMDSVRPIRMNGIAGMEHDPTTGQLF
jgi:hypothetical protein